MKKWILFLMLLGLFALPVGAQNEKTLTLRIGSTDVAVKWEDNASVEALKALCEHGPLTISMSMYGGFEQVGPLGTTLPSNNVSTTTAAGDIVLYANSQIVIFYGSNTWSYTRLGHITDRDAAGMAALLGNGDVTVTLATVTAGSTPGDVNADGAVNAKDVTHLRRSIAGGYAETAPAERTDLNRDGTANPKDVTLLRRFLAGGYGVTLL